MKGSEGCSLLLLLDYASGDNSRCAVRTLKQCVLQRGPWGQKWRLPANGHKMSQLGSESSGLKWDSGWWQPRLTSWLWPHERPWDRTSHLRHSWIPDSQKIYQIISIVLVRYILGVICYITMDNLKQCLILNRQRICLIYLFLPGANMYWASIICQILC